MHQEQVAGFAGEIGGTMDFEVLPVAFARNPIFKADVQALMAVSPEKLMQLRNLIGKERELDESILAKAQELLGVRREVASRIAVTLGYLLARIAGSDFRPAQLVAELQRLVERRLEDSESRALEEVFSPSSDDLEFEYSSTAFAFGDTLIGATFNPLYAFGIGEQSDRLFAGMAWSISYRSGSSNEPRTLTLNASALELREMAKRMARAADEAEAKLASIRSGK